MLRKHAWRNLVLIGLALVWAGTPLLAQEGGEAAASYDINKVTLDTLWVLFTAFLVFWMNAGFGLLETGFCRAKNAVNILAKNVIVFAISSIAFFLVGFAIMFGDGNSFMGLTGWLLAGVDNSPATGEAYQGVYSALNWTGVPLSAKFFFQLVFAGTAATIVSGAVAERIKFISFIAFSFVLTAVIYPIGGHWAWGGGWLQQMGFADFAGSTVVHSIGGWAALMGVLILGARTGKYGPKGRINVIPGHNMGFATLGTLILWLGWFGFNPGSTMAADFGAISTIALNTNMAAAAGCVAATAASWLLMKKPDLSMLLNGTLAGLVAITAGCNAVSSLGAMAIGAIAGFIVVPSVMMFDRIRVDDPVGALSVHLVNGMFGTLAVGVFAVEGGLLYGGGFQKLWVQFVGVAAIGALVAVGTAVTWLALKYTIGVRVSEEEELEGLDVGEHGMEAYPGFVQARAQQPATEIV
ncbi:MAG: ammonium transporter [Acidobacteria bacterium]|nr:ammonium transporter [Acidobacteriota bacterium]